MNIFSWNILYNECRTDVLISEKILENLDLNNLVVRLALDVSFQLAYALVVILNRAWMFTHFMYCT